MICGLGGGLESLLGPVLVVFGRSFGPLLGPAGGRPGLLGSCAPGEDFDENQLIKYGSRGLFETLLSSLGNGAAVAASWGTPWAPGLLGRTSRAPAEAGVTLESHFSHGREGARGRGGGECHLRCACPPPHTHHHQHCSELEYHHNQHRSI